MHFLAIHKKVVKRMWGNLSRYERDLIASSPEEAAIFENRTVAEATRLYEDENFYYNNPYTFKAQY